MTATMIKTPERSLAQRMDALRKANEVRSRKAEFKRDLRTHRQALAPAIESPPEYLETAKVFELLLAAPKVGRVKATKMLRKAGVSPSKTFGGLSPRQRTELVAILRGARL